MSREIKRDIKTRGVTFVGKLSLLGLLPETINVLRVQTGNLATSCSGNAGEDGARLYLGTRFN